MRSGIDDGDGVAKAICDVDALTIRRDCDRFRRGAERHGRDHRPGRGIDGPDLHTDDVSRPENGSGRIDRRLPDSPDQRPSVHDCVARRADHGNRVPALIGHVHSRPIRTRGDSPWKESHGDGRDHRLSCRPNDRDAVIAPIGDVGKLSVGGDGDRLRLRPDGDQARDRIARRIENRNASAAVERLTGDVEDLSVGCEGRLIRVTVGVRNARDQSIGLCVDDENRPDPLVGHVDVGLSSRETARE